MKCIMILLAIVFMSGCSTKSPICSIPEADNSVVCKLSEKIGTSPEAISKTLKIGNVAALEFKLYEAREAERFINKVIDKIEYRRRQGSEITYREAVEYVRKLYKGLSPRVQAAFEIINPDILSQKLVDIKLTDHDFNMLLKHLNEQKVIVQLYRGI